MYHYMKHGSQLSLIQQKLVMVKCNIILKGYYGIEYNSDCLEYISRHSG